MVNELLLFLRSLLYGAVMAAGYDFLRIIRRIICHNTVFVIVEDILYWIAGSLFLFVKIYQQNDGVLRGYIFIGLIVGMVLWHYTLGEYLVKWIPRGIGFGVKRLKYFMLRCRIALCKQFSRKL